MKKLFTLLTMLIVAISTSWADTDSYNVTAWSSGTGSKSFTMAGGAITVNAYIQSKKYNNVSSTIVAFVDGSNMLKFTATSACINSITLTGNTDDNSNTRKLKYATSEDGNTWSDYVTLNETFSNRQSTPVARTISFAEPVQYVRFLRAESNSISIGNIAIDYNTGGGSKTASECAFATAEPAINFPGTATYTQEATTATGYDGTVTYALSNNTCGASINETTHQVTVTQEGSVTVTATAPETTNYASSSASYTLTVTDTRTALTASWDNAAPVFTIDEAATKPEFTVTGGDAVLGTDYTVAYEKVSGDDLATIGATGITAINTSAAGTETIKATVTVINSAYKITTTEYNCVITVANTHSVTYDANGGSGTVPTDATSYASGASVTVADNIGTLTKAGYSVIGWNTDSEATTASQAFGSSLTMGNEDVTLYAIWQKNDYTFTPKTVTESTNVAKNATVDSSIGGVMKNTQTDDTAGRIQYTTEGLLFASSSNSKITVTLNYDLQVGSVITATFWNNDTKEDRGVDILNAAGQDKGDWLYTGDSKEHRFAYVVTSSDGFAGTNSFSLKRKGNAYLKSLTVTNCNKESYYVTVGESGFATIGMPFATTLPAGVTGYAVESVVTSKVKMSSAIDPATTIPANTGLVIVATPATYKFSQTGAGTWSGSNLLEAVGETPKAASEQAPIYVLTITDATNKKVGFKKATSGSLGAYKAYLPGTVSTQNTLSVSFDDETAVEAIAEANEADAAAPVKVVKNGQLFIGDFNVAGQQVK